MNTITVSEFKDLKNPLIIDIRDNFNYNNSHIPSAINIPELILKEMPARYLSKNNTYYLYCSIGKQSLILSNYLNSIGYHCYTLEGGYQEYRRNLEIY